MLLGGADAEASFDSSGEEIDSYNGETEPGEQEPTGDSQESTNSRILDFRLVSSSNDPTIRVYRSNVRNSRSMSQMNFESYFFGIFANEMVLFFNDLYNQFRCPFRFWSNVDIQFSRETDMGRSVIAALFFQNPQWKL